MVIIINTLCMPGPYFAAGETSLVADSLFMVSAITLEDHDHSWCKDIYSTGEWQQLVSTTFCLFTWALPKSSVESRYERLFHQHHRPNVSLAYLLPFRW